MPQQKVTAKEAEVRFLKEGDLAPDFELADATGAKHRLSALRGSKIVLSFHRFAA
jgi:peroxiredoxin